MKNIIKASLSLLSVITLLTACSGENDTNPIVGTVAEGEIPSEPKLFHSSISENLEDIKAGAPVKSITGLCGEELSVDSAVNVFPPDPETHSNYAFEYDHAYFTYNASFYEMSSIDSEESIYRIHLDSSESVEKYNEYLKSKSNVYIVKKGDKLKNGLICTDAETDFCYNDNGDISLLYTEAYFSGELTLTGTIHCLQEEEAEENVVIVGKGDLCFIPDADNGNIPNQYEMSFPKTAEIDSTQFIFEKFQLGNISELSEEFASLIKDNKYTNVQVTLKDIRVRCMNAGTDYGSFAVLVDMKVI